MMILLCLVLCSSVLTFLADAQAVCLCSTFINCVQQASASRELVKSLCRDQCGSEIGANAAGVSQCYQARDNAKSLRDQQYQACIEVNYPPCDQNAFNPSAGSNTRYPNSITNNARDRSKRHGGGFGDRAFQNSLPASLRNYEDCYRQCYQDQLVTLGLSNFGRGRGGRGRGGFQDGGFGHRRGKRSLELDSELELGVNYRQKRCGDNGASFDYRTCAANLTCTYNRPNPTQAERDNCAAQVGYPTDRTAREALKQQEFQVFCNCLANLVPGVDCLNTTTNTGNFNFNRGDGGGRFGGRGRGGRG